jgi:hypothetical protein
VEEKLRIVAETHEPGATVGAAAVSLVRYDGEVTRNYVRNHEQEDQRLEQMNLWR